MSIFDWSRTALSNGTADPTINWAEGQPPSSVNDSARSMMARLAYFRDWLAGAVTQGGASNAYTITSGESLASYANGMRFLWKPNANATGAVTLNIDGIGAKKVYMPSGSQAGSGDISVNAYYDVVYDPALDSSNGGFKIVGAPDATNTALFLAAANNLSDVASAPSALTNLGALPAASYTAADVLAKLLTEDGAGSELDADKLDGLHGSAFAQLAASSQNFTGNLGVKATGVLGAPFQIGDSVVGRPTYGGQQLIIGYQTSSNAVQGIEFQGRADGGGYGNRIFHLSNDGDLVFEGRYGSASWTELGRIVSSGLSMRAATSPETSGTLIAASANRQITAAGNITLPSGVFAAGDMIIIEGGGTARTITRGSGLTMYKAGADSASATLAANGLMGVRFRSASVCVLTGDVS